MARDFPALHDLEMREMYGDDWEQRAMIDHASCVDIIDDMNEHEVESLEEKCDLAMFESGYEDEWIPF